jgi:integrase
LKQVSGRWVLDVKDHKTARHGKPRIIVLTPTMDRLCLTLAEENPTGPLFRNKRRQPWQEASIIRNFQRYRDALGINPKATAYSYRHRYCTRWLHAGKSIATLAALVGNTIQVLEHHYAHLLSDVNALYAQLLA